MVVRRMFALSASLALLSACVAQPGGSLSTSETPRATASASPLATPTAPEPTFSPLITPTPASPSLAPEPTRDARYVPITRLKLAPDRVSIGLDFSGWAAFSPEDPCSADYSATTVVSGGVLEVGVFQSKPPPPSKPPACDLLGHARHVQVALGEPFTGSTWRDLYGPYLHFLEPPAHLVELAGLPAGWLLRSGEDVDESPTGRWKRTYSPDAVPADPVRTLVLIEAFGAPANVTGGTEERAVTVSGAPATLYRFPPTGELVLVWGFENDGLALVGYETQFPPERLIELAESARR